MTLSSRVVTQRAGNRHLLVIHRVRSDDSATYMCYATNEFGSSQKTIAFDDQVSILPTFNELLCPNRFILILLRSISSTCLRAAFYAHKNTKNTVKPTISLFMLLGSALVKASSKMLVTAQRVQCKSWA